MANSTNESLWSRYHDAALQRGWLAAELLSQRLDLKGARVADLGCGAGGATLQLAERGAVVAAVDCRLDATQKLLDKVHGQGLSVSVHCADIKTWQPPQPQDVVLLWDVLEHVPDPLPLLRQINGYLNPQGCMLLATPNKWSPVNLICDPHYSLPVLACCKRSWVAWVVIKKLGWFTAEKSDIAQLLSWRELRALLNRAGFEYHWVVRQVTERALQEPQSVWNRSWHLRIIRFLTAWLPHRLLGWLPKKPGLINQWLLPTFYLVAYKR